MICPRCMGIRKIVEYDNLRKVFYSHKCEHCYDTGEIEQTNEEVFIKVSTWGKAKIIADLLTDENDSDEKWESIYNRIGNWLNETYKE